MIFKYQFFFILWIIQSLSYAQIEFDFSYYKNFVRHSEGEFCTHVPPQASFVAYLNGVEIARSNIGNIGDTPPFDQLANGPIEAKMVNEIPPMIAEIMNNTDKLGEYHKGRAFSTPYVAPSDDW